jgi:multiple sugar transport system permease protein
MRVSARFGDEQRRTALLALLPSFLVFAVFTLYPLVYSLIMSFTNAGLLKHGSEFVGLQNYIGLLNDSSFKKAMLNTLLYTIGVVPFCNIVSFLLAMALNRKLRLTALYRTAFFMPVVASTASVATVWFLFYDPYYGGLNGLLSKFGILGPAWLSDPRWALFAIIIMSIWKNLGYSMVIFLAGLQDVPQDLYDAASLDGAGGWQMSRNITLPMMSRVIAFTMIMSTVRSFQVFGQIRIMTGGGPVDSTLVAVYYVYKQAFESPYRFGYASAAAWLVFLAIGALSALQYRYVRRLDS